MRKVKLFIAMSLDGYIATENDSIDWLESVEGLGDNGYKVFYNTVDTLILGRRTYDWVMQHMDVYPYKGKMSYVLTNRELEDTSEVKFVSDAVALTDKLKKQKGKDIWLVGGGKAVQSLMEAKLVDEFLITIAPVVLGKGIPLFSSVEQNLEQISITAFNQFTQIYYRRRGE